MAGSQKAEIELVAKDTSVLQAFEKLHRLTDKTVDKLNRVEQASKKGTKAAESGFGDATMAVGRFVGAISGIGSVVGGITAAATQLRREWENLRSAQKDAANTQVTLAAAERQLLAQFVPDATLNKSQLDQRLNDIASRTGASRASLFTATASALNFVGTKGTNQQAVDAVDLAARLFPGSPGDIEPIAQGLLTQQLQTGGTARDVMGFQLGGQAASPVTSFPDFSTNIIPAVAALSTDMFGNTPRESMAFLAAVGQEIADKEGRVTRNAMIKFQMQIEELVSDEEGGDSLLEKLAFLRSEAGSKKRRKLLGPLEKQLKDAKKNREPGQVGLTGEARALPALIGLLSTDKTSIQIGLDAALAEIPDVQNAGRVFDTKLAQMNDSTLQTAAKLQRQGQQATEGLQLIDTEGAITAIIREQRAKMTKAIGDSAFAQSAASVQFEITSLDSVEAARREFERRVTELRSDQPLFESAFGRMQDRTPDVGVVSPREIAMAEAIEGFVNTLKEIQADQRRLAAPPQQQPRQPAQAGLDRNN